MPSRSADSCKQVPSFHSASIAQRKDWQSKKVRGQQAFYSKAPPKITTVEGEDFHRL